MQSILNELLIGNKRFASESNNFQNLSKKRRLEGLDGQNPKAIIIGCSDSRIVPEYIFDQGLGDLFVIRVAGNVVDNNVMASIEYAVSQLSTPLIIVLSHSNCGAVESAIELDEKKAPGQIGSLIKSIKPAIEKAKVLDGNLLDNSSKENSKLILENLSHDSEILLDAINNNKLLAIAAHYDIKTGLVEIL